MMQALSLFCLPSMVGYLFLPVLTAFGQSRAALRFTMTQLVLTLALALVAAPFGLWAIILSLLARGYLLLPYQLKIIEKYTNCSLLQAAQAVIRPLGAALCMALACYWLTEYALAPISYVVVRLAISISVGIVIYSTILAMIDRRSINWLIEIMKQQLGKRGAH
jgi:hypothetical protein